jgi:hypothetical protein
MRHRSHAAGLVALIISLLAAAPAPAARVLNTERDVYVNGHQVTQVQHVDDPRWGMTAERFDRSFHGDAPLDGPLTDPVQRGAARMLSGTATRDTRATGPTTPANYWCGETRLTDDTGHERTNLPRYKVIYAYPTGATNRMATYQDVFQQAPTWIANKIAASAGGLRGPRFDYGTTCGPQFVDITQVVLSHTKAQYDALTDINARASTVKADITAAIPGLGLSTGKWNYLVFADGVSPLSDPRSVGYMYMDDEAGASNANEAGGNMALILGSGGANFVGDSQDYLAYSVTHEIGHTLGAVQDSAPHSTGAGHCTNGYAIMCYGDGGPTGSFTASACPTGSTAGYANTAFQCGTDDYIASVPALGGYLINHWNVFDSSFMCDVDTCLSSQFAPTPVLNVSASRVPAGTTITLDGSGSTDRGGSITGYEWDLDGDGVFERNTAAAPTTTLALPRQGTRRVALRVTNDSGLSATAGTTIAVDGTAPVAVLSVPATAVAGQPFVLDASGSSDADEGDALSFAWDTGQTGFSPPNASTMQFTPTRTGSLTVRVRVTDTTGASSIASATVSVSAPPVAATTAPATPAAAAAAAKLHPAKFVSLKLTKAGTTLVVLECPATGPVCRGRATVSVGKRSRVLAYAIAAGRRHTLAIRPPVRLLGRKARAAKLVVADESGATITRSFKLRKR